ncbi:hypothetical protein P0082_08695 [Candidatus Haliotispira prima]|uniref:Uncharacterized protein n=1 Tax=Candidatus Haliotispira prima TaxID=3034016 RepID=A0ABY8MEY6_9SPIO|nr:hypothetical protein P0082_08695 [Candidatus Haliotispira prima]
MLQEGGKTNGENRLTPGRPTGTVPGCVPGRISGQYLGRVLGYVALFVMSFGNFFSIAAIAAQVSVTGTNNPVVEKNDYIVRFSPRTGSYSLYKREVGKNRLVRLINDREPRSTYIAVALNGRVHTLGRSTRYLAGKSERMILLSDGGAMSWKLPKRINVKYYVRVLSESSLTSYLRLNIIVENASSVTQSVGLFHMFDVANNNLGLPAFSLPDGDVFRETILEARQVPYFVQTSYNAYFYLDVRGSTRPDRVILANWTKLHEAGWNYGFQLNSQGFGYNLYDSNNPAMGVYYDARPLSARQSRSYVLYLAFDAVPSFSNFNEFDDAQVLLRETPDDEPVVEEREPKSPDPVYIQESVPVYRDNSETDDLLRELIAAQRRNNELLEQYEEPAAAAAPTVVLSPQSKQDSVVTTRFLPDIDIQALNLLYNSENKRFAQLGIWQDNLEVEQKLHQAKLQQISPYRALRSPEESLQAWQVQQTRLLGQLDNWNTYLVNILARLPEPLHNEPEVIKFHNNLRDLRLTFKELSDQWTPLIQRVEATWNDWQSGKVGEPAKRISDSFYRNQQALAGYMNELSDLARYSNGVQQRLEVPLAPLYGEMSNTLLAVRERVTDINEIIQKLYQEFSDYAEQSNVQIDIKARLQKNLFSNEQQVKSSRREIGSIEGQLQVAFSNIRILEQWQEAVDLQKSRMAYDPYRKERDIKELLQQIGAKIDGRNQTLQALQRAQNDLQSELDVQQIVKITFAKSPQKSGESGGLWVSAEGYRPAKDYRPAKSYQPAKGHRAMPEILEQALNAWAGSGRIATNRVSDPFGYGGNDRQPVQLVNPYPYKSGESTPRNKMADTVRPQVNENELYNALKGFPDEGAPPLPERRRERKVEVIAGRAKNQAPTSGRPKYKVVTNSETSGPIIPDSDAVGPGSSVAVTPSSNTSGGIYDRQSVRPKTLVPGNNRARSQSSSVVSPPYGVLNPGEQSIRSALPPSPSDQGYRDRRSRTVTPSRGQNSLLKGNDSQALDRPGDRRTNLSSPGITPLGPQYRNLLSRQSGQVISRSAEGLKGLERSGVTTADPNYRNWTREQAGQVLSRSAEGVNGLERSGVTTADPNYRSWTREQDGQVALSRSAEGVNGLERSGVTTADPNYRNWTREQAGQVLSRSAEGVNGLERSGVTTADPSYQSWKKEQDGQVALSRSAEGVNGLERSGVTTADPNYQSWVREQGGQAALSRSAEGVNGLERSGVTTADPNYQSWVREQGGQAALSRSAEGVNGLERSGVTTADPSYQSWKREQVGQALSRSAEGVNGLERSGVTTADPNYQSWVREQGGQAALSRSAEGVSGLERSGVTTADPNYQSWVREQGGQAALSRSAEGVNGLERSGVTTADPNYQSWKREQVGQALSRSAEGVSGLERSGVTTADPNYQSWVREQGGQILSRSAEGVSGLERSGVTTADPNYQNWVREQGGQALSRSAEGVSGLERSGVTTADPNYRNWTREQAGQVLSRSAEGVSGLERSGVTTADPNYQSWVREQGGQVLSRSAEGVNGLERSGVTTADPNYQSWVREQGGQALSRSAEGVNGLERSGVTTADPNYQSWVREQGGQALLRSAEGVSGLERSGVTTADPNYQSWVREQGGQALSRSAEGVSGLERSGVTTADPNYQSWVREQGGQALSRSAEGVSGLERSGVTTADPNYQSWVREQGGQALSRSAEGVSGLERSGVTTADPNYQSWVREQGGQALLRSAEGLKGLERSGVTTADPNYQSWVREQGGQALLRSAEGLKGLERSGVTTADPNYQSWVREQGGQALLRSAEGLKGLERSGVTTADPNYQSWVREQGGQALLRSAEGLKGLERSGVTTADPNYQSWVREQGGQALLRSAEGLKGLERSGVTTADPNYQSWVREQGGQALLRSAEGLKGLERSGVTTADPNYQSWERVEGSNVQFRNAESSEEKRNGNGTRVLPTDIPGGYYRDSESASRSADGLGALSPEDGRVQSRGAESSARRRGGNRTRVLPTDMPDGYYRQSDSTLYSRSADGLRGLSPEGGRVQSRGTESSAVRRGGNGTRVLPTGTPDGYSRGSESASRSADGLRGLSPEGGRVQSRGTESSARRRGGNGTRVLPTGTPDGYSRGSESASRSADGLRGLSPEGGRVQSRGTESSARRRGGNGTRVLPTGMPDGYYRESDSTLYSRSADGLGGLSPEDGRVRSRGAESSERRRGNSRAGVLPSGVQGSYRSNRTVVPGGITESEAGIDRPVPYGATGNGVIYDRRPETVRPSSVDPGNGATRSKIPSRSVQRRPSNKNANDPYRDVKIFIRDVEGYLGNRKLEDQDVNSSEKRWSRLEEKYNIPK